MKKLDAVGYVDGELIEKAEKYTKKKNAWGKWAALAACLCLILVGAFAISKGRPTGELIDDTVLPDTPTVTDAGLYIPAMELPEVSEGIAVDMLGLVVYKGGIYTQAGSYYGAEAESIEGLVGDYLGHAAGSIDEWSTQDEYAEEFASTYVGEVYTVRGYDPDFRLCIRVELEDGLYIELLDRLNDITLSTGADLFETRLGLRDRISAIRWQSHADWNEARGNMQTAELDPALWERFLDELDSGSFVNTWDPEKMSNSIYAAEKQAHIFLAMEDGTTVPLRLIDGGYVGYDPLSWCFVKIPGETFDAVFTACGGNG